MRHRLNITSLDKLESFIDVNNEQFAIIKSQKYVLEDVNRLMLEIGKLENKIDVLKTRNERKEIVDILSEYRVINMNDSVDVPVSDNSSLKEYDPNMIVTMDDPDKIDIDNVKNTAKVVMKKVVMAIEPKKFTRRKTAKELQEKRKEDKVILDEVEIKEPPKEISIESDDTFTISDPFLDDNVVFNSVDPFLDDDNIQKKEEMLSNMPKIENIGSVKPTSKLTEIEKISEENSDIVLPTMGLTNNQNNGLPTTSGEYLSNNGTTNNN